MILHLISKPGSSRKNKTGSWRAGRKPKFLQEKCIACRMCLLICPEGCIDGDKKRTFHCDYAYCKGCALCAAVCPVDDIAMVDESEETK